MTGERTLNCTCDEGRDGPQAVVLCPVHGQPGPRMGHQDRAYSARIDRLRRRLDRGPLDATALSAVIKGLLDVVADLVADQEEQGR